MLITKVSMYSGKTNTLDLDITKEELYKWNNGALIQDVAPRLSVSEREFLITGMTPEEWEELTEIEDEF